MRKRRRENLRLKGVALTKYMKLGDANPAGMTKRVG